MPKRSRKSIPEPWLSFLRELDAAVDEEVRLDCMGGFVVTLMYGFSRPTGDVDILEITPATAGRYRVQTSKIVTKVQRQPLLSQSGHSPIFFKI